MIGCSKPSECMHVHVGGSMLEFCGPQVRCGKTEDKEEKSTMKFCEYIEPVKTKGE
jgi:hypothetical protein